MLNKKKESFNVNPTFDIIMCCFNNEKYIEEAIESVLKQTYPYWELILIDDFSQDNSREIIKKYCENYLNIHASFKEKNGGYGGAMNLGISILQGELIALVDGDDWIFPNALEIMVKAHKDYPNAALIYSKYVICNEKLKAKHLGRSDSLEGKSILEAWADPNGPRMSHLKTFKRKFYNMTKGVNPKLRKAVDKDLVLKLEEVGDVIFIPEILYKHRRHKNTISYKYRSRPDICKMIKDRLIRNAKRRRGLL